MAYPNDVPSLNMSEVWTEGSYTPYDVVRHIRDNETPVDKNSIINSVGYQISLIQNFVNANYLGRRTLPVNSGFIYNLESSGAEIAVLFSDQYLDSHVPSQSYYQYHSTISGSYMDFRFYEFDFYNTYFWNRGLTITHSGLRMDWDLYYNAALNLDLAGLSLNAEYGIVKYTQSGVFAIPYVNRTFTVSGYNDLWLFGNNIAVSGANLLLTSGTLSSYLYSSGLYINDYYYTESSRLTNKRLDFYDGEVPSYLAMVLSSDVGVISGGFPLNDVNYFTLNVIAGSINFRSIRNDHAYYGGNYNFYAMPVVDPQVSGLLWRDGTTVKYSIGP